MRIGLHLVKFDFEGGPAAIGPTVAAVGAAVEEAGLDNLSLMDHYLQLEFMGPRDGQMLEGYTTLGFLAAHTSTVDLQLMVTGVTYRHPALLAKIVTTLDVLSGGRAVLGLGAAWYEQEHRALGVPFPPVAERFERLEETLQIVHQMFDGEPHGLRGPPLPARRPGELTGPGPAAADHGRRRRRAEDAAPGREVRRRVQPLRQRRQRPGRRRHRSWTCCAATVTPRAPTTTRSPRPSCGRDRLDPADTTVVEQLRGFVDIGVAEVHVMHLGDDPVGFVQELGRTFVPAVHDL